MGGAGYIFTGEHDADIMHNSCQINLNVLDVMKKKGIKFKAVSSLMKSRYPLEKIKEEIKKCEVRCANCHRRKTAVEFKWFKNNKPL
jgi:hypothetical protein